MCNKNAYLNINALFIGTCVHYTTTLTQLFSQHVFQDKKCGKREAARTYLYYYQQLICESLVQCAYLGTYKATHIRPYCTYASSTHNITISNLDHENTKGYYSKVCTLYMDETTLHKKCSQFMYNVNSRCINIHFCIQILNISWEGVVCRIDSSLL